MVHLYKFVTTLFAFALVIGPAIFFHELGHFIFAKRFGVKVYTFSIGFGKRIWSKMYNGTEYCVSWIPLGGYIKMAGEDPSEPMSGAPDEFPAKPVWQRAIIIAAGPIANLILGFCIGVLIFLIGPETTTFLPKVGYVSQELARSVMVGDVIKSMNGEKISSWANFERIERSSAGKSIAMKLERGGAMVDATITPAHRELSNRVPWLVRAEIAADDMMMGDGVSGIGPWVDPVIGTKSEGGAADQAGLLPGDKVVAFAGKPIAQWGDLGEAIRSAPVGDEKVEKQERWWSIWFPGFMRPVMSTFWPEESWKVHGIPQTIEIARNGEHMSISVTPKTVYVPTTDGGTDSFTGIGISPVMKNAPQHPMRAFISSAFLTVKLGKLIVDTLKKLLTGAVSAKLLSGPLGIAQASGSQMREGGLMSILQFLALISVNLGVVNLFPFPLLDGGWLFIFFLYEILARKPMSPKMQENVLKVGIAGLLALVVFITFNDFGRLLGFQKVDDIMRVQRSK